MAMVYARYMTEINERVLETGASFAQQYMLNKGLKVFGERGRAAAGKELDQLHRRNCFKLIMVSDMSPTERQKAQQALMFLTQKRDNSIKGRMVYNGKPTRVWIGKEDAASPTVSQESIFITAAQGRS